MMIGEKTLPDATGRDDSAIPATPRTIVLVARVAFVPFFALLVLGNFVPANLNPTYDVILVFTWLFSFFTLVACALVADAHTQSQKRLQHDPWPICQHCDTPRPPHNESVIVTWKCPHCGASALDDLGKGKKAHPFDPDF